MYGAILNTLLNNKGHRFIIRETLTTFITLIDCSVKSMDGKTGGISRPQQVHTFKNRQEQN